jgi:hypothetical protein
LNVSFSGPETIFESVSPTDLTVFVMPCAIEVRVEGSEEGAEVDNGMGGLTMISVEGSVVASLVP